MLFDQVWTIIEWIEWVLVPRPLWGRQWRMDPATCFSRWKLRRKVGINGPEQDIRCTIQSMVRVSQKAQLWFCFGFWPPDQPASTRQLIIMYRPTRAGRVPPARPLRRKATNIVISGHQVFQCPGHQVCLSSSNAPVGIIASPIDQRSRWCSCEGHDLRCPMASLHGSRMM
jgi:hypothetical protein